MNWLLASIAAQTVLGTSAIFDKLLIKRASIDPWVYTFWSAVLGLMVIFLAPFAAGIPSAGTVALGIGGGIIFTGATFLFFLAIRRSEASVALPIIGGIAPLFTLAISIALGTKSMTTGEVAGFVLLVAGGAALIGAERRGARSMTVLIAAASAACYGVYNVLAHEVFVRSGIVAGLIAVRLGSAIAVLLPLLLPELRRAIASSARESAPRNRVLYLANRAYAAVGSVLGSIALSLAHPALVDASSGLKYVVIFLGAWIVLRERFHGGTLALKLIAAACITGGIAWLGFVAYLHDRPLPERPAWGITFSSLMARHMGLDPRETLRAVIDDLRPAGLRLVAYWDEIEPRDGERDFSPLDWQMDMARNAGVPVVLAVGQRVPRWPECHVPAWVSDKGKATREEALLRYLRTTIERYRTDPALAYWQVENEPFLRFGECPPPDAALLDREIAAVKELDPAHPVLLTDGGEFGDWYRALSRADMFGTTMYRKVHSNTFGYFTYPLTPDYFPLKAAVVRALAGRSDTPAIVIELGLEPWGKLQPYETPIEEQYRQFSPEDMADTISYARAAGFDTYYLWGAEWWYWMRTKHGDPRYWDAARTAIENGALQKEESRL